MKPCLLKLAWNPPATYANGQPIVVNHYAIDWELQGDRSEAFGGHYAFEPETTCVLPQPGVYEILVRTVDNLGHASEPARLTAWADNIELRIRLHDGGIAIEWEGDPHAIYHVDRMVDDGSNWLLCRAIPAPANGFCFVLLPPGNYRVRSAVASPLTQPVGRPA